MCFINLEDYKNISKQKDSIMEQGRHNICSNKKLERKKTQEYKKGGVFNERKIKLFSNFERIKREKETFLRSRCRC